MRLHIAAVGNRMPAWVDAGVAEYAKRFPAHCRLALSEIPAKKRAKGADIQRILEDECTRLLGAIPERARVIALERTGKSRSTEDIAQALGRWLNEESEVAFLIGGPEGLAPACLGRAHEQWSLSALTLPHPLVRVILAEQLYRAYSLLHNLPYHRGE